jgi:apolipoprotein N-acyltransferase
LRRALALAFAHPRKLALLLGALAATGFEPLRLWPLALLALAGLIELIARAACLRQALLTGWLFGVAHLTIGNNWIATAFTHQAAMPAWLGWIAVLGIALYLAVWPALAAGAAWRFGRGSSAAMIPVFAGSWTLTEWLRGWVFTGFPWNPLAMLTLGPFERPGLAAMAPWLGTYALSGVVVVLAGVWLLAARRGKADWRGAALVLIPLALLGLLPGRSGTPAAAKGPAYTLVQPFTPQEVLHDPAQYEASFQRAMKLSQARAPGQVRLVLWPESGLPDFLHPGYPQQWYDATTYGGDPAAARRRIGRMIGANSLLLTGNDQLEVEGGKVVGARAGIAAIDPSGGIRATYAKAHLVPYGEYVPLKWLLEPLGLARFVPGAVEFWPGPGRQTLDLGPWGKGGMLLCYEVIFPGEVTQPGKRPDFLFNPSNDGWYGAWGPPQHLAQSRLRAIEEGLPMLRSTTTGISAVIDAEGAVLQSIPFGRAGRLDGMMPAPRPPTLFARLGNLLSLGWGIVFIALGMVASRRRQG